MKFIYQGAEAIINLDGDIIVKERISKSYRIKDIDFNLRRSRTRSEAKLLKKAESFSPKVLDVDNKNMIIRMEYVRGDLLKDVFNSLNENDRKLILFEVGKNIAFLHEKNIVHGDLTTSNIIVKEKKPFFIDFGLGYVSLKVEDKAVDLHLLRQALDSKHYKFSEKAFDYVLEGYSSYSDSGVVLKRLEKVESRGRYKGKK